MTVYFCTHSCPFEESENENSYTLHCRKGRGKAPILNIILHKHKLGFKEKRLENMLQ